MSIEEILEEIKNDKLLQVSTTDLKGETMYYQMLRNKRFAAIGIKLITEKKIDEAERIFAAMLEKGETSSATRNNYGAVILNDAASKIREHKPVNLERIKKAKEVIFEACDFDKKVSHSWPTAPAYKNLCWLRNMEAYLWYSKRDLLGAFVIAWVSIEMTVHRIWFQYLQKTCSAIVDQQAMYKKIMSWRVKDKLRILFKAGIIDEKIKTRLDALIEIRNKLVHGEINDPTGKNVIECIDVGNGLIPVLQS